MKNEAGKGDTYRPVDRKKWEENYERIFKKTEKIENAQKKSDKR